GSQTFPERFEISTRAQVYRQSLRSKKIFPMTNDHVQRLQNREKTVRGIRDVGGCRRAQHRQVDRTFGKQSGRRKSERRFARSILKIDSEDWPSANSRKHVNYVSVRLAEFPFGGGVREAVEIRIDRADRIRVDLFPRAVIGCVTSNHSHEAVSTVRGIVPHSFAFGTPRR